jgi:hypothetical protein
LRGILFLQCAREQKSEARDWIMFAEFESHSVPCEANGTGYELHCPVNRNLNSLRSAASGGSAACCQHSSTFI